MHELQIYRCVICHSEFLEIQAHESTESACIICTSCKTKFPFRHNILDTLVRPSQEVLKELQGIAMEADLPAEAWDSMRIRKAEGPLTLSARLSLTDGQPVEYYQQTQQHFEQAVRQLGSFHPARVLEVGSMADYFFLQYFRDRGAKCHAVNISFWYKEPDAFWEWPEKALADMNELPFRDGVFDLVLFSATLHHSPDLHQTMQEISRVTHPGGTVLVLSEQIGGWFKRSDRYSHRNSQIHETYRSFFQYHYNFTHTGFQPIYLFSAHFDKKLMERKIHPRARFAVLGKIMSYCWKYKYVRFIVRGKLIYIAHILFGFPLNAVLRKNAKAMNVSV